MKDRIQQIMLHEGMNQQEFSKATGIAPASLSSIFTGRTMPTLKHAEALHQHFPNLNISWLLFGTGEMTIDSQSPLTQEVPEGFVSSSSSVSGTHSEGAPAGLPFQFGTDLGASAGPVSGATAGATAAALSPSESALQAGPVVQVPLELLKKTDIKPRRIAEIRIFFDDGTYEVFQGNL